jgi:hypothetical protein
VLRHGAVAQAGNLRENESHSVDPLVRRGSVLRRPGRSLRLHEANEIRIGHEGSVGLFPHLERWGVDKTAIICLAKYFNSALQSFDVGLGAGL